MLWLPPVQGNGIILHYTIYYQKIGSETKSRKVSASQSSYELNGLEENELYAFWVTASTKDGEGPASEYLIGIPSNKTPAKIASFNKTVIFESNEGIMLSCPAFGEPTPNITWQVSFIFSLAHKILCNCIDFKVHGDFYERFTNYSLQIFIDDDQNITCIVENELGKDSNTYDLRRRGKIWKFVINIYINKIQTNPTIFS